MTFADTDSEKLESVIKHEIKTSSEELTQIADFFNSLDTVFEKKEVIEPENETITAEDIKNTRIIPNFKKLMIKLGLKSLTGASVYTDFALSCLSLLILVSKKKKKTIMKLFKKKKPATAPEKKEGLKNETD